jgi:hypothetical protein
MRTRGAVLLEVPGRYEVVDLDVDDQRPGEIRVRTVASGLRHSGFDGMHAGRNLRGVVMFDAPERSA